MIAKNYIKYPEALRFQCEMFSNGYKNSPRIMRLMTVLFDWKEAAPQWWKSFKALENLLIKGWKEMQLDFFTKRGEVANHETPKPRELSKEHRFTPILHAYEGHSDIIRCGGTYRNFCQQCNTWAKNTDTWQYHGGFSH
jgi:hypothetical protein